MFHRWHRAEDCGRAVVCSTPLHCLRSLLLGLAVLSLICLVVRPACAQSGSFLDQAADYRYAAMRGYLAAKGAAWDLGFGSAVRPESLAETIYANWLLHPVGMAREGLRLGRRDFFCRTLVEIMQMPGNLVREATRSDAAYLDNDMVALLEKAHSITSDLNSAMAEGDPVLQGLNIRYCLLSSSQAARTALELKGAFAATSILMALNMDQQVLFAAVPVALSESTEMLRAVKASTGDADLAAACDRLMGNWRPGAPTTCSARPRWP